MRRIVLASQSASRRALLTSAGVAHEAVSPGVDENALKRAYDGPPNGLAQHLADAKALAVDAPGALVIGGDQVLVFKGKTFDKPRDVEEAVQRLTMMSGDDHDLIGGLAIALDGEVIWRHESRCTMDMHVLTEAEARDYLAAAGEKVLRTVGAYEVEGLGARLFERIDGDFFAVLGLDLLPLLTELRRHGALSW